MKNTPQVYVLTLNSLSKKHLRLWTGESVHALRHCSVKQLGHALMEMQQQVNTLQGDDKTSPSGGGSYSLNRAR